MRPLLLALVLAAPALAQEEAGPTKYDLRERYVPQVGDRVLLEERERLDNRYAIMQRGVAIERAAESAGRDQARVEEVLRVAEDEIADFRFTYERFKDLAEDEDHPVEGLVVTYTESEGTTSWSVPAGRELPAALRTVLDEEAGEAAEESEEDRQALLPEQPVAVGETWEISLEQMAEHFDLQPDDLIPERCSASGKLVTVGQEGEHEFRVIELTLDVATKVFQGMPCPEPVVFTMRATIRISPQVPYGSMELTGTIKGHATPPDFPPGAYLELDSKIEKRELRKPAE